MMIGIMSDSHDNLDAMTEAVKLFKERKVELVLHAGDFIAPFTVRCFEGLTARVFGVFGNNDGEKIHLKERYAPIGEIYNDPLIFKIHEKSIVVTHKPELVDPLAHSNKFDLIVYGHTHRADVRTIGKTLIINPGECGGWLHGTKSIAILDLDNMTPEIIEL